MATKNNVYLVTTTEKYVYELAPGVMVIVAESKEKALAMAEKNFPVTGYVKDIQLITTEKTGIKFVQTPAID